MAKRFMEPKLETFEEYWERGPGLGDLTYFKREFVMAVAKACYVAGQAGALKWANKKLP